MNNRKDAIYDSITKEQLMLLFGISGFIGLLIYMVCYGPSLLDVTNDSWLLQGGDLMQHYVGWKAYRASDWHFPIGMTDGLLYPDQTCVVFTDSIPLFAIFFKILSPILPETFQYFGLWGALTYILMGGISAVILRKSTKHLSLCVIGSIFFSFSPYVIQRMYSHTALAGNWLILLAIAIWVYKPFFSSFWRKTIAWTLLLVCGSLVHIYYIPMIMIFMIFSCVQDLLENNGWMWDLFMGIIAIGTDLLVLYGVGAFSAAASMEDAGLGEYSSNLNAFINPLGKGDFFKSLPHNPGQDEGYGYLGLGILILLAIAMILMIFCFVWHMFKGKHLKNSRTTPKNCKPDQAKASQSSKIFLSFINRHSFSISMLLAWLAAFILALSPVVTWNETTILEISYPEFIIKLLSIFRSTGRFIWCACYILMLFAITAVIRHIRWFASAAAVLTVTAGLQVADLDRYAMDRGDQAANNYRESIMKSVDLWDALAEGKTHLTYVPFSIIKTTYDDNALYEFANFAIDHDMTVNFYMAARVDINVRNERDAQVKQSLASYLKDYETLYILDSVIAGEEYGMVVEMLDGIVVGYYQ